VNLYETLGVAPGANEADIKAAYRKLAREHHPDKGGDVARFQAIEEAYRILSDKAKRAKYDSTGSTQRQADPQQRARQMIATVFAQLLQGNNFAERDYVRLIKSSLEQNESKQHNDKVKCEQFVTKVGKLIELTEGEVLLGVLNQRLDVARGQIDNADDTLETIARARDLIKGCKCGADIDQCIVGHLPREGVRVVFEHQQ
jgi:curved DNA-binding protein CbpA